jgi:hypothetical protein
LLSEAFERVLEQLVEVGARTPAPEDSRRMRYDSMTRATPMMTAYSRMSQRSTLMEPSQANTNADRAIATAAANATARQVTASARNSSGIT